MKRLIHIAIIMALAAMVAGCDKDAYSFYEGDYAPDRYVLQFVNTTESTVSFFVPSRAVGSLPKELDEWYKANFYDVEPHASLVLYSVYDGKESPIETYKRGEKVPFYVFDKKVLEEKTWTEIVDGEMWLAKYEYTATRILEMGKRVTYPEVEPVIPE